MQEEVKKIIKSALKKRKYELSEEEFLNSIEIPKDNSNGDICFKCFILSKKYTEPPHEIAKDLRAEIGDAKGFQEINLVGPYLNFHLDKKVMAINLLKKLKKGKLANFKKENKKIVMEFPSPNTNKPLHLGHLRNMSIGESISRILELFGNKVVRVNLNNDRGIHICKSMAAYEKYAKGKKPDIKGDHFVGKYYVMFSKNSKKNEKLELESHRMLQRYEEGDKDTVKLWRKMNSWALEGFKETYDTFGINFDKQYFESEIYKEGKDIILKGYDKKLFYKNDDGAIAVDLDKYGLGEKILLRSNGTSLYITQDIILAQKKIEEFSPDQSIYITGNEQDYHFKVLFQILKILKMKNAEKLKHLSYGMVVLPNGKMKSREGTVVDADDLIEELRVEVEKDLKKRYKLGKRELKDRSLKIALAAIKYFLLKVDINKDMMFDPKKSISFEGNTGPYLQYSFARASSILRKDTENKKAKIPGEFSNVENILIMKLNDFENVLIRAREKMNPTEISNYCYELSQTFNEFYHEVKVLGSEYQVFYTELIKVFKETLKTGLYLLGIETLEVM